VSAHTVQWVSPSPLWSNTLHAGLDTVTLGQQMRQPAVLRFTQDKFMDALAQTLAQDPAELDANLATPVTYRLSAPGEDQPPQPTQLKLFQAAHGHFYLVAASLTCRLPGLPDHDVNTSAKEKVSFVLRRVDTDGSEWGWGDDPANPGGQTWLQIDSSAVQSVAPGEDLLPLFPVRYQSGDQLRRIYVGLVPTSSSDNFKAAAAKPGDAKSLLAPTSDSDPSAAPTDPRPAALTTKVTDPLRALAAAPTKAPTEVTDVTQQQAIQKAQEDQLVQASRFLLVDFAEFLVTNMSNLWTALNQQTRPGDASAALYDALNDEPADSNASTSWRQALIDAWTTAPVLYGDKTGTLPAPLNLANSPLTGDELDTLVKAALPPQAAGTGTADLVTSIQGDSTTPPQVPKLDPRGTWIYQIRCVYQRPLCGALEPDQLSDPTTQFEIASFFDLDAPSRQIFISLPVNTGISDLRKLRKNVTFLISDQLRSQMNRVTNLNDALKGQFADGGSFDLGLMCSFSIPIITICALLVLLIFVELLNIVFWWLPFLRICVPIGLKSDSS